jgi:SAM-dependent methyltransferase
VRKDVLEIACGSGMGLGYLKKFARVVVGGDIDETILQFAVRQYGKRAGIELRRLNAEKLPFINDSFDVAILFEAIYYIKKPVKFVTEACRVLRPSGKLLICTVNKDWGEFNPSPFSNKYFSADELYKLLREYFAQVEVYGAFSAIPNSGKDKIISLLKKTAAKLDLIPESMKGKEFYKRIFFGKLTPLPGEVNDGICDYVNPVRISHNTPNHDYKILYAVAHNH